MTKVLIRILLLITLSMLSTSCVMNLSVEDMNAKSPSSERLDQTKLDKIFVDLTEVTLVEGSLAIINVAVNPVRSVDTKIRLTLTSPSSSHIRFNPIPIQIIIPAGMTSKSVTLSSIDDSLVQAQEVWNFNIVPLDEGIVAEPGKLVITLNDNDGGYIPNAPATTPVPKILGELNPFPVGVTGVSLQNKVIFKGADAANGYELWVSDGTSLGTYLLKDINPGANSSNPESFFKSEDDSYVLFLATTPNEGKELWRTDGTPEGTILLKDSYPGVQNSSNVDFSFTKGNKVFYGATDPVYGTEVNVSDGTVAGTHVLKDIAPGSGANNDIGKFVYFNSEIYFGYNDKSVNYEAAIWKTDGTESGTVKAVSGLSSGDTFVYYSDFTSFTEINGKLIFAGDTNTYGSEVYVTDGTTAGTTLLKDFYTTAPFYDSFAIPTGHTVNSKASILMTYDNNASNGIWFTDGTTAGTTKILTTAVINNSTFGTVNGKLVFPGRNPTTGEIEPWATDGTAPGTVMLKDINTGNDAFGNPRSSAPTFVGKLGNKIIFTATSEAEGTELWATDGTPAGTVILSDIIPGSLSSYTNNYRIINDKIYFSAFHLSYGNELWVTDGTQIGTKLFKDIQPGTASSGPITLFNMNNTGMLFAAYNSAAQFGTLFYSDLTEGGTVGISHALVDSNGSLTTFFSYFQGHVFFNAKDSSNGNPLWVTDGTSANTYKIKDIFPNSSCMDITSIREVNNTLIFTASNDTNGKELWTTDGTAAGTQMIKDIYAGSANGATGGSFTPNNSGTKSYFSGADANGTELWVTDGTTAGTAMVKDTYTGTTSGTPNSGSPSNITFVPGINEFLFFAGKSSDGRRYVYRSDGTTAGTVEVTGFGTYSASALFKTSNSIIISVTDSGKYRLYAYDKVTKGVTLLNTTYNTDLIPSGGGGITYNARFDKLFYSTSASGNTSHKVWVTDGTVGGTTVIKTAVTASYDSASISYVHDNGTIAIFAYTFSYLPNKGEIWMTDGTAGGTTNVKNLVNSVNISLKHNNLFYFTTSTAAEGNELWVTDGTTVGTKMLKDIYPGSANSDPNNLTVFNNQVYFTANNPDYGVELWRTNGQSSGTELVYDINPGSGSSSPGTLTPIGSTLYFKATKILSGSEVWTYTP
jgi:ELWxxDGT repeat protein